jgi:hypothetical protein
MTEEERNRDIVEQVRLELAPAFDEFTPEIGPAPVYTLHDDM